MTSTPLVISQKEIPVVEFRRLPYITITKPLRNYKHTHIRKSFAIFNYEEDQDEDCRHNSRTGWSRRRRRMIMICKRTIVLLVAAAAAVVCFCLLVSASPDVYNGASADTVKNQQLSNVSMSSSSTTQQQQQQQQQLSSAPHPFSAYRQRQSSLHRHHRKFLLLSTTLDEGAGSNRINDLCSRDDIVVYQGPTSPLPNGIPTYTVQVLNVCVSGCTISNIHVSCGWFSSARMINPSVFRRLCYDDCLANNGEPLGPGESLSFQYANSFEYPLSISSVACYG